MFTSFFGSGRSLRIGQWVSLLVIVLFIAFKLFASYRAIEWQYWAVMLSLLGIFLVFSLWQRKQGNPWAIWAWVGAALMGLIIDIQVQASVFLNEWYGKFYDMLQKPETGSVAKFWEYMLQFSYIAFPLIFIGMFSSYFASHYAFRWREAMTKNFIPRWRNTAEDVEGASQRVQEDCARFARLLESMGLGLFRALLTLIAFIPILWKLSSGIGIAWLDFQGSLVVVAVAVSLGGMLISWFVGIKLPGLEYNNQKVEAAFRKQLVYGEDDRQQFAEVGTLLELFTGVRTNYFRLFNHYAYFNLWAGLYSQLMIIFPYVLMGPSVMTQAITLGVMTQVGNAFGKVNDAFSYLIHRWTDITELRSIHKRLAEFEKSIEPA